MPSANHSATERAESARPAVRAFMPRGSGVPDYPRAVPAWFALADEVADAEDRALRAVLAAIQSGDGGRAERIVRRLLTEPAVDVAAEL